MRGWKNEPLHTATPGCTGYGAYIAHISNAIEHHQKWRGAAVYYMADAILKIHVLEKPGQCHHTLMLCLSKAVQLLLGNLSQRNIKLSCETLNRRDVFARCRTKEEYLFNSCT